MSLRMTPYGIAALVAGAMLAPAASHAFTFEDGAGNKIPEFNLEDQAKQFRKTEPDMSAIGKSAVETPFGKLEFGVRRESSPFGYGFGSGSVFTSDSAIRDRQHFNRMLAPPNSIERD